MSRPSFTEALASRPWLLADGATGTNYFQMGLESGDAPEMWNLEHPERVRDLHRRFIAAGADIILTNTFGGNRHRLKLHNAQDRVAEINIAAVKNARAEADAAGRPVYVGGSIGPTGEILEPVGTLSHDDAVAAFAEQAMALKEGGADVLWIETMSSEEELKAAVEGAAKAGLPIVTTMSFDTNGRTMMGITPKAFGAITAALPVQPVAIGANCGVGASELIATVLGISEARPDAAVVAKGNCGIPAICRWPYPLHWHAGTDGRLCAHRTGCRRQDHRRLLRHEPGASCRHAQVAGELQPGRAAERRTHRTEAGSGIGTGQGRRYGCGRCGAARTPPRLIEARDLMPVKAGLSGPLQAPSHARSRLSQGGDLGVPRSFRRTP